MTDIDLTTRLAKIHRKALGDQVYTRWEDLDAEAISSSVSAIIAVLAELHHQGLLAPDGGRALTAEQVEDVRIVTTEVGGYTGEQFRRWHGAKDRLVDALFSATKPAEPMRFSILEGRCGFCDMSIAFCDRSGGCMESRAAKARRAAAAVPAEEEAKAEALTTFLEGVLEYDSAEMGWHLPGDWDPTDLADAIMHAPASSPVAPGPAKTGPRYCPACKLNVPNAPYCNNCGGDTPAETGPWQTWEAVPEGVKYHGIGAGGGVVYVNYGGQRFRAESGARSMNTDHSVQMTAPFVAAEEKDA